MIKSIRDGYTSKDSRGSTRGPLATERPICSRDNNKSATDTWNDDIEESNNGSRERDGNKQELQLCDDTNGTEDEKIIVEDITEEESLKDSLEFLNSLDVETVNEKFPVHKYGPQEFQGKIYGHKMFHRYRQFCLNTEYATKGGFAVGHFFTEVSCEVCGWTKDKFPSVQKRLILIPAHDCKMCQITKKYNDPGILLEYKTKLMEEFSYYETKTKNNRDFKINRVDSKEPY